MRTLAIGLVVAMTAACGSSSSGMEAPPSAAERCFAGSFGVTFGGETSGGKGCPDLTSTSASWVLNVDGRGNVLAPGPSGATARAGSTFDTSTCRASYTFDLAADACASEAFAYDLTFTTAGFEGVYTFTGCGASCVYPIHGARK